MVLFFKLFGLAARCLQPMQSVSEKQIKQLVWYMSSDEFTRWSGLSLYILTGFLEIGNLKHFAKRKC